jgi:hypothetical protein
MLYGLSVQLTMQLIGQLTVQADCVLTSWYGPIQRQHMAQ